MKGKNIYLVGFMGAGKSSVGRRLAVLLGRPFFDADTGIVERSGKSIPELFDNDGVDVFRDVESAVVAELSEKNEVVVALGGGAVLRPENVALLKASGVLVHLSCSFETAKRRIEGDGTDKRPLSRTGAGLRELYGKRLPVYLEVCDFETDTDEGSPDEIARRIGRALGAG